ncbi:hypothetical protein GJW-30_1_03166 [Variibacter gotjawalensis]|uniref:AlpA family phage regulatory protein n=1 Tax=Variibacter gotjawalensis TaxID=1333996 RepID=A0A0S3PXF2_9BRAD|nr:hypothetical protein [Variibacter gotjawalensis]NIK46450.1 hypothetical protein [Variibacter gotjawalensis]RZS48360.1 hypothetical protein EV661_0770 [Variibacter gotjawalensis]BAT60618.1 hypothetical protein GJW-30_1_03166 [Variibacter gotjawalensis]
MSRRLIWRGKGIAAYLNQTDRWLERQLQRGKRPPPVFRIGSALAAYAEDLDAWLAEWKARRQSA